MQRQRNKDLEKIHLKKKKEFNAFIQKVTLAKSNGFQTKAKENDKEGKEQELTGEFTNAAQDSGLNLNVICLHKGDGGGNTVFRLHEKSNKYKDIILVVQEPRYNPKVINALNNANFLAKEFYVNESSQYGCRVALMEDISNNLMKQAKINEKNQNDRIEAAKNVGVKVFEMLEELRKKGIVWKDLKPENILLRDDGSIAISDLKAFDFLDNIKSFGNTTKGYLPNSMFNEDGSYKNEMVDNDNINRWDEIYNYQFAVILYHQLTGKLVDNDLKNKKITKQQQDKEKLVGDFVFDDKISPSEERLKKIILSLKYNQLDYKEATQLLKVLDDEKQFKDTLDRISDLKWRKAREKLEYDKKQTEIFDILHSQLNGTSAVNIINIIVSMKGEEKNKIYTAHDVANKTILHYFAENPSKNTYTLEDLEKLLKLNVFDNFNKPVIMNPFFSVQIGGDDITAYDLAIKTKNQVFLDAVNNVVAWGCNSANPDIKNMYTKIRSKMVKVTPTVSRMNIDKSVSEKFNEQLIKIKSDQASFIEIEKAITQIGLILSFSKFPQKIEYGYHEVKTLPDWQLIQNLINKQDDEGNTLLHYIALKIRVAKGGDDGEGPTDDHLANKLEFIAQNLICEQGANPFIKNKDEKVSVADILPDVVREALNDPANIHVQIAKHLNFLRDIEDPHGNLKDQVEYLSSLQMAHEANKKFDFFANIEINKAKKENQQSQRSENIDLQTKSGPKESTKNHIDEHVFISPKSENVNAPLQSIESVIGDKVVNVPTKDGTTKFVKIVDLDIKDIRELIKRGSPGSPSPSDADIIGMYFALSKNVGDLNKQDKDNNTVLHLLAAQAEAYPTTTTGFAEYSLLIRDLIANYGADPTKLNKDNKTAIDIAKEKPDITNRKLNDVVVQMTDGIREWKKIAKPSDQKEVGTWLETIELGQPKNENPDFDPRAQLVIMQIQTRDWQGQSEEDKKPLKNLIESKLSDAKKNSISDLAYVYVINQNNTTELLRVERVPDEKNVGGKFTYVSLPIENDTLKEINSLLKNEKVNSIPGDTSIKLLKRTSKESKKIFDTVEDVNIKFFKADLKNTKPEDGNNESIMTEANKSKNDKKSEHKNPTIENPENAVEENPLTSEQLAAIGKNILEKASASRVAQANVSSNAYVSNIFDLSDDLPQSNNESISSKGSSEAVIKKQTERESQSTAQTTRKKKFYTSDLDKKTDVSHIDEKTSQKNNGNEDQIFIKKDGHGTDIIEKSTIPENDSSKINSPKTPAATSAKPFESKEKSQRPSTPIPQTHTEALKPRVNAETPIAKASTERVDVPLTLDQYKINEVTALIEETKKHYEKMSNEPRKKDYFGKNKLILEGLNAALVKINNDSNEPETRLKETMDTLTNVSKKFRVSPFEMLENTFIQNFNAMKIISEKTLYKNAEGSLKKNPVSPGKKPPAVVNMTLDEKERKEKENALNRAYQNQFGLQNAVGQAEMDLARAMEENKKAMLFEDRAKNQRDTNENNPFYKKAYEDAKSDTKTSLTSIANAQEKLDKATQDFAEARLKIQEAINDLITPLKYNIAANPNLSGKEKSNFISYKDMIYQTELAPGKKVASILDYNTQGKPSLNICFEEGEYSPEQCQEWVKKDVERFQQHFPNSAIHISGNFPEAYIEALKQHCKENKINLFDQNGQLMVHQAPEIAIDNQNINTSKPVAASIPKDEAPAPSMPSVPPISTNSGVNRLSKESRITKSQKIMPRQVVTPGVTDQGTNISASNTTPAQKQSDIIGVNKTQPISSTQPTMKVEAQTISIPLVPPIPKDQVQAFSLPPVPPIPTNSTNLMNSQNKTQEKAQSRPFVLTAFESMPIQHSYTRDMSTREREKHIKSFLERLIKDAMVLVDEVEKMNNPGDEKTEKKKEELFEGLEKFVKNTKNNLNNLSTTEWKNFQNMRSDLNKLSIDIKKHKDVITGEKGDTESDSNGTKMKKT